jgi:hypothetical protein
MITSGRKNKKIKAHECLVFWKWLLLTTNPLLPLWICKKNSTPSPSLTIQHPKKRFKNKINPLPLPSPFNIFLKKNPDPPTHSTMKKLRKNNHPFPFLLPHVKWKQKKTLTFTPLPLNKKKTKKGKKTRRTLSPLAQWIQHKPWPFSTVKSHLRKLQTVKKVTKNNKLYPCFSSKK